MQTLQFGGKNWSKSLTALGKKLSRYFEIVPLRTQQEIDMVSMATRKGRPGWEVLMAGIGARAGEVATAADHPSRFDGTGDDTRSCTV